MEKESQQTPKEQKPKRVSGQMMACIEVDGEEFPFLLTMEQLADYRKSLKKQKTKKGKREE